VYRYLIETKGCDVNAKDEYNDTPLHYALRYFNPHNGEITVLMYLLNQKGINVNIKGQYDNTILHTACENINTLPLEIFKVLIETLCCDSNVLERYDYTPVHLAFQQFDPRNGGDINILYYLLNQNGLNFTNQYGITLLHYACVNINMLPLELFKFLIEIKGCDVNVRDDDDDTPIRDALSFFDPKRSDITILTYLLTQHSTNINIMDNKGRTLLHLACVHYLVDSKDSVELQAECDTILCQVVEVIAERCVQQILDETKF
jgi:ankyrin repeat protein